MIRKEELAKRAKLAKRNGAQRAGEPRSGVHEPRLGEKRRGGMPVWR